jgi:hypothetical protein
MRVSFAGHLGRKPTIPVGLVYGAQTPGVFYIGFGDKFDGDAVTGYPPGTVLVLPGDTWHFHWAKSGEYVTQVTAIGPLGLEYANIADDPRHGAADVPT